MLRQPRARRPPVLQGAHGLALGALLAAASLLVSSGVASAQEGGAIRIAYVDMKRLIDDSPQVREARARLQRDFDASVALLREDERRLSGLEQRLGASSGEEAPRLRAEIESLRRSVERTRERLRGELETRSEQEVQRAWPVLNEAISQYARENGLDLVVSSGALYVSGRVDITDRVLDLLERDREAQP